MQSKSKYKASYLDEREMVLTFNSEELSKTAFLSSVNGIGLPPSRNVLLHLTHTVTYTDASTTIYKHSIVSSL